MSLPSRLWRQRERVWNLAVLVQLGKDVDDHRLGLVQEDIVIVRWAPVRATSGGVELENHFLTP